MEIFTPNISNRSANIKKRKFDEKTTDSNKNKNANIIAAVVFREGADDDDDDEAHKQTSEPET